MFGIQNLWSTDLWGMEALISVHSAEYHWYWMNLLLFFSPSGRILRVESGCLCYRGLYGGYASRAKWDQSREVRSI